MRGVRLDEDWFLVMLGLLVVAIALSMTTASAWTAHDRDGVLRDARATAGRLAADGLDDKLYQDLITLQQHEAELFQAKSDQASASADPRKDLVRVEADLAVIGDRLSGLPGVEDNVSKIRRELSRYTGLMGTAHAENQQGLPVGAAHLREASGYLTDHILRSADAIRKTDQARGVKDNSASAAFPWLLAVVCGTGLAGLVWVQVMTARRVRRTLNAGLLLASAAALTLTVWSLAVLYVSAHTAEGQAMPHANAAKYLTQARVDAMRAHTDDLLTQAVHNEDCAASAKTAAAAYQYSVVCSYETDTLKILGSKGRLADGLDLATKYTSDRRTVDDVSRARRLASGWAGHEKELPTLQNLAALPRQGGLQPRYDDSFLRRLDPYTAPVTAGNQEKTTVQRDYKNTQEALTNGTGVEWDLYRSGVADALDPLTGLFPGSLVLGLLAAVAGAYGVGRRVAEYWSAGGGNA